MSHKLRNAFIFFILLIVIHASTTYAEPLTERYMAEVHSEKNRQNVMDFIKKNPSIHLIDTFAFGTSTYFVLEGPSESIRKLKELPAIYRLEKDQPVQLDSAIVTAASQKISWGIQKIEADRLYSKPCRCKIAVIDTGVSDHDDLKGRIQAKITYLYDTEIKRQAEDDSPEQHGTHVAGIIAANHNSFGITGVEPNATLLISKALDKNGEGYLSDIAKSISWAISLKADIINLSLGVKNKSTILESILEQAYHQGIIIVAAAGNSAGDLYYPASSPYTISVGAIDQSYRMPSWSAFDERLDILAPGVSILSTAWTNEYVYLSGTSMAAPHVAGAAAKLLPKYSGGKNEARVEWIRKRLREYADQITIYYQSKTIQVPVVNVYRSYYAISLLKDPLYYLDANDEKKEIASDILKQYTDSYQRITIQTSKGTVSFQLNK
jgi:subtilisin